VAVSRASLRGKAAVVPAQLITRCNALKYMGMDTKFFTNEADDKLLERFKSALVHSLSFDVLSGYFRASGFSMLAQSLSDVEKIRILVGLNTDREIVGAAAAQNGLLPHHVHSHAEMHAEYSAAVQREMEEAPETQETEDAISLFVKFLNEGRIEIRGHPSRNIHAKVYILHYRDDQATSGCVITGSSNFSYSGLTAQREFNVELRDPGDLAFASRRFEKLWDESVELTGEFKNTVHNKTWFNNEITPYELYLKFIYEYFREDINIDEIDSTMLPEGFRALEYQQQAVVAAKKILNIHNCGRTRQNFYCRHAPPEYRRQETDNMPANIKTILGRVVKIVLCPSF